MASCPFCNGTIEEELAIHGGPCPHCFVDIPGEETATDPGEEAAAEIRAADLQRAKKRARAPLAFAVPVVAIVLGATAWAVWPQPTVEALTFDENDFAFEIDLAAWEPPEEEATDDAEAVAQAAPRQRQAKRPAAATPSGSAGDLSDRLASTAAATEAGSTRRDGSAASGSDGGVRDIGAVAATQRASGSADLDVAFNAQRTAALLSSRDDIQSAVSDMLRARVPRLQQCFERHLKQNDSLGGQWRLAFVIGEDGTAEDPTASGVHMSDDAFERCIVKDMEGWRIYGRLAKAWPVSLPVSFKNEG